MKQMLHKYCAAKFNNAPNNISNLFETVLTEMKDNDISKPQEQANTIKNCRSTNFIIKLTEYLLNGFLKDSKKLFNLFLRLQIHMINGDVNFYLPCCVTSLRFVFGLDNSFVRGLLQMAGTQLLNDISDSLTNKLDGEMWEEILPMLHIITSTNNSNYDGNSIGMDMNSSDHSLKERLLQHVGNKVNNRQQAQEIGKQHLSKNNNLIVNDIVDSSDDEAAKVGKLILEEVVDENVCS